MYRLRRNRKSFRLKTFNKKRTFELKRIFFTTLRRYKYPTNYRGTIFIYDTYI